MVARMGASAAAIVAASLLQTLWASPSLVAYDLLYPNTSLSLVQKSIALKRAFDIPTFARRVTEMLFGHEDEDLLEDVPMIPFYMYDPSIYEPRFEGSLSKCERKGADYMFLESLLESKSRASDYNDSKVVIVPCLFESFRRCTSTNHAEKPPASLLNTNGSRTALMPPHPEDFEDVPWAKPLDADTATCLVKVMESDAYKRHSGRDHLWVAADWAMNFGMTMELRILENMTVGRIEAVDDAEGAVAHREMAVNQSKCSVVVPYASDVGYAEDFSRTVTFEQWWNRPKAVNFRFDDRRYVLFCQAQPCEGAVDATPLRRRSLAFRKLLGGFKHASIFMRRTKLESYFKELHQAKFCLVIRGDTPSTHALYDALAANCIPVIVSDRWPAVANPYSWGSRGHLAGGTDFKDFALTFSEDDWLHNATGVAAEFQRVLNSEVLCRQYFKAMQKARSTLLWSKASGSISARVLRAANSCMADSS